MMPPKTTASISKEERALLSSGQMASRTLVDILVVDFAVLMEAVSRMPAHAIAQLRVAEGVSTDAAAATAMCATLESLRAPVPKAWKPGAKLGITQRMALAGGLIAKHDAANVDALASHASDTVRGWAAYAITRGERSPEKLAAKVRCIKPLAADEHSGVREWAWLSVRPFVDDEPEKAIASLLPWTASKDANLRRFASEVTRPRGVWCGHIKLFKANPAAGLAVIEPLKADMSRYVQNSVANWLNDAGKSDAVFVRQVVKRWQRESASASTAYIVKRAVRSL
jgi:3-methyladenine DNA glycosylase AlkC